MEGDVFPLKNTRNLSLPQIATRVGIVFRILKHSSLPQIRQELAFGPENLCLPWMRSLAR